MKVLVHYEQEFFIFYRMKIRSIEKITIVVEAKSKKDLLIEFQKINFIPNYLKNISDGKDIEVGKKTMIWYLPESFKPHF